VAGEAEPDAPIATEKSPPPPLPQRLLALPPVVYTGTALWLVALVALLIARYGFDAGPPIWMWTALAGFLLGLLGVPIMAWQRRASRRGARGAQRNL
jgi:membrane associated rhomboid family serine protease